MQRGWRPSTQATPLLNQIRGNPNLSHKGIKIEGRNYIPTKMCKTQLEW